MSYTDGDRFADKGLSRRRLQDSKVLSLLSSSNLHLQSRLSAKCHFAVKLGIQNFLHLLNVRIQHQNPLYRPGLYTQRRKLTLFEESIKRIKHLKSIKQSAGITNILLLSLAPYDGEKQWEATLSHYKPCNKHKKV